MEVDSRLHLSEHSVCCSTHKRASEDMLSRISENDQRASKWPEGEPTGESVFADAFTDFTVNRALLAAGTLLLRNAIVARVPPAVSR